MHDLAKRYARGSSGARTGKVVRSPGMLKRKLQSRLPTPYSALVSQTSRLAYRRYVEALCLQVIRQCGVHIRRGQGYKVPAFLWCWLGRMHCVDGGGGETEWWGSDTARAAPVAVENVPRLITIIPRLRTIRIAHDRTTWMSSTEGENYFISVTTRCNHPMVDGSEDECIDEIIV